MIAIGIGCRKACREADIVALVRDALACLRPSAMACGLFTFSDKRDEPGLALAAAALGLPLVFLERAALGSTAPRAKTCSPRIMERYGVPSIAETAALAGAGPGAVLLVERIQCATATCAIAGPRAVGAVPG